MDSPKENILENKDIVFMNTIFKTIIDRAAETAIGSVPEARAKIIKQCLMKNKAAVASPDVFQSYLDCTSEHEGDDSYMPDMSGTLFVSVFIDEFTRLAAAALAKKNQSTKFIYERVVIYFCMAISANYPYYEFDEICPYVIDYDTGEFDESTNIVDNSWKCIALLMITVNDEIRKANAMPQYCDAMFINKITGIGK